MPPAKRLVATSSQVEVTRLDNSTTTLTVSAIGNLKKYEYKEPGRIIFYITTYLIGGVQHFDISDRTPNLP